MSAGLSYGLNLTKKANGSRSQPARRKPIFDEDDDSDGDGGSAEVRGISGSPWKPGPLQSGLDPSNGAKPKLNSTNSKHTPMSMYGDLSASFTSKKAAEAAEELDANIYDYDAIYDSLKPEKRTTQEDKERKPKYMKGLLDAAAIRKRDANIAEEKKLAREREDEGDEYAGKEKFVTSAYKKQQEENRRLADEEKIREEEEAKKNKGAGMTNLYKVMLERGEKKHAEVVKAVEERIKNGPKQEEEVEKPKTEAEIAREINGENANGIAVNDEGQVVDKRELLKGGLNIVLKPKGAATANAFRGGSRMSDKSRVSGFAGAGGAQPTARERQSRMMEAQLEQATKRALEEDEEERQKVERASKSRKTNGDIMSAKERYLARKKEAEEAKKRGE